MARFAASDIMRCDSLLFSLGAEVERGRDGRTCLKAWRRAAARRVNEACIVRVIESAVGMVR